MKTVLATGIIGIVVTAAGCSQLWSPSQGPPATFAGGLPQPPQSSTSPDAPGLQEGSGLSSLSRAMLTPHPAALASAGLLSPSASFEPEISGQSIGGNIDTVTSDRSTGAITATPAVGGAAGTLVTPGPQGPPTLLLKTADSIVSVGRNVEIQLILSSAPTGLSGFIFDLEVDEPTVAEIVSATYPKILKTPGIPGGQSVPQFGLATVSSLPAASATFQAVDLSQLLGPTSVEVLLVTVEVRGKSRGSTDIRVVITRVDDDDGNPVDPPTLPIRLSVQ